MEWLIAIIFIGILIYFGRRHDKDMEERAAKARERHEQELLSDAGIARAQTKFEESLIHGRRYPDAIAGYEAYIYWRLMRKWYPKLVAKARYDKQRDEEVRRDWLGYMDLLQEASTSHFLSMEGDENEREQWDQSARDEHAAYKAIEDAFAAAMGKGAVAQLEQARNRWLELLDFDDFTDDSEDDSGSKEAPRRRRKNRPRRQAPRPLPHDQSHLRP